MSTLKQMQRAGFSAVALVATLILGSPAYAQTLPRVGSLRVNADAKSTQVVALKRADYPKQAIAATRFAPIAAERVQRLLQRQNEPGPLQIGIARDLASESDSPAVPRLTWLKTADGGQAARMDVTSPDAHALRVGIQINAVAAGTELRVFGSADADRVVGAVTAKQIKASLVDNSIYWTPHTDGETQTIEWYLPAGAAPSALRLRVVGVSHLMTSAHEGFSLAKAGCNIFGTLNCSAACEHDIACVQHPSQAFDDAVNSVALTELVVGGTAFQCTGTLLNDTLNSGTPYLYSAEHCMDNQASANTLNTFWFRENVNCGGAVVLPSDYTERTNGADVLYSDQPTDVLLLRLRDTPPAGSVLGGWDANAVPAGIGMTVIHHPKGDAKKVSTGSVFGVIGTITIEPSGQTYHNLNGVSFTSGIIEEGSSGSALMTQDSSGNYYLRGGLLGGDPRLTCSTIGQSIQNGNSASFSRFDLAFINLEQYLAPGNSSFQITQGITGNWYDTSESGHGFGIEVLSGNQMLAEWYVYGPQGGQAWIVGTGPVSGDTAVLQAFQGEGSGGRFPPNFNAALVHDQSWGTITFTFSDCNNGTASWQPIAAGYLPGSIPITRLTIPAGLACP